MLSARRVARCAPRRRVTCRAAAAEPKLDYNTSAFQKDLVEFAGEPEYIVKGGRDKFEQLPAAFKGIKEVSFLCCTLYSG